jgi:hypothetical protein
MNCVNKIIEAESAARRSFSEAGQRPKKSNDLLLKKRRAY